MNEEEIAKLEGESIIASYAHLSPPLRTDFRPPLAIGFLWDPPTHDFTLDERLDEMQSLKEEYGHVNVPEGYSSGLGAGKNLGKWVSNRRQRWREGKVKEEEIAKLNGKSNCFTFYVSSFSWWIGIQAHNQIKCSNSDGL